MEIYFKNNNPDGPFLIDCLGFWFECPYGELYRVDEEFDYEDDFQENEELVELVKDETITIFLGNRELTVREAVEFLSTQSHLEDSENEKWLYPANSKSTVDRFSQLHITNRPLILDEGVSLELGEGADIIFD